MQEPRDGTGRGLASVVDALGTEIVAMAAPPPGEDPEVLGPRIFDPDDPVSVEPGDIVLGIAGGRQVVERAATAGAAAVALKSADPDLIASARELGIALLSVAAGVSWDQFHALVRNAVAANGAPGAPGDSAPVGDLFALANAVAAMVGGAVTIEDPQSKLLAYSSLDHPIDEPRRQTILGRRVPDPWTTRLRDEGVFRELWSSPGVVCFEAPDSDARRRLAVAIRAGSEPLGSIWVVEGEETLGPDAERALGEAARVAALHVLRHRAAEDVDRRERGVLLRALLEGRAPASEGAPRLGIDAESPCAVLGFRLLIEDDAEANLKRARAVDLITVYCEAFRRRAACVAIDADVYALLPSLGPESRVMALARDIAEHAAGALGTELVVGVGSTVPTLADAPLSRMDADRVLKVLGSSDAGTVAHIDEVRIRSIVGELGEMVRRRPDLRLPALDQLSQSYLDTLRAYLDAFGDIAAAAAAIGLHPNSFRYRLRRLGELAAIDLDDPEARLVCELLLRLP